MNVFFMDGKNRVIYVYKQIVENDCKAASLLLFKKWISAGSLRTIKKEGSAFIAIHILLLIHTLLC
jgi:hypothetical protein